MTIGGVVFVALFMFLLGAVITYVAIRSGEKAVGGPVAEALSAMDEQIRLLEQARVGAYARMVEQVASLKGQTQQLAQALAAPTGRGRWGELQLRRVVELAGMLEHCDFAQQVTVGEDTRQRPDMVIRLPGNRSVVVDAKAPIDANARVIRSHVVALSRKAYWEQFQPAPDLVVLFLAGEHTYSAALQEDPSLIESDGRIVIATPTTLIAMLRAIAFGWREQSMADDARKIVDLGRELHKRVGDMADQFDNMGRALSKSVEAYNRSVHHLESRVLVTARKLDPVGPREILKPAVIELQPRLFK